MSEAITFTPCPSNIFKEHIQEYFERSRDECPQIEAIYGKWCFEDLIPGLSDFDTRFIFSDDTTTDDWIRISKAVGRVHTEICRENPARARILEHLPGINLKWDETQDSMFYYPEFHQWTAYHGIEENISKFSDHLSSLSWNTADELFNIKKFALYFGPYNRTIDPPINLGEFEKKYSLHSRFMHYFCPPVQCAVNIMEKRMVRGKRESLNLARKLFPNESVIDMTLETLDRHYEISEFYREPRLTEIETMLFSYLENVFRIISPEITVINIQPGDTSKELKEKLGKVKAGLMVKFFEGAKFSRLMMGRLLFYADNISHFDSIWLIQNELGRIKKLFFETTFTAFGLIAWGNALKPEDILERCRGTFLDETEYIKVRSYAEIFNKPYNSGAIKEYALEVAAVMGPFQVVLEKLGGIAKDIIRKNSLI